MPDYTKLGKAIMEASYSYPVGEDKPPPEIDGHEILASCNWSNSLSLGLNLRDIGKPKHAVFYNLSIRHRGR